MLKKIKSLFSKVGEYMEERSENKKEQEKLRKWKKKLENALSDHQSFRQKVDEWDALYHGTHDVDGSTKVYMSDRYNKSTKKARQVVNIVLQLIESQINLDIPYPNILPTEPNDEKAAKVIQGMVKHKIDNSNIEEINDENERIVKKTSICWYKVNWDPNIKKHAFTGDIVITNPHPKNVIPQPGVYRVEDMDYIFHIENRTIEYVERVYGEEVAEKLRDENAEYEYLEYSGEEENQEYNTDVETNRVSIVECWYKDKDNDVCLLAWANDVIIRDIPKFFYKRDEEGNIITEEEITIVNDETGESETVTVPYRAPKRFPFVLQKNIPRDKSIYGKSDPEIIKDQQEAIKKMLSIQEEKLVKGTTKIFTNDEKIYQTLTNAVSQIILTDKPPESAVKAIDMKTSDNDYIKYFEILLQSAKDVLGIQDAWVGKAPSDIRSGKALQQLAQNAASRINTKVNCKRRAYKQLYQIMVDFMLAFYEEDRPYRILGDDNRHEYGMFRRGDIVRRDTAGQFFYPEFDVKIDTSDKMPHDKMFLLEQTIRMYDRGAIDKLMLWTILEDIGFPKAGTIKEMLMEAQQQPEQQAPQQDPKQILQQLVSQFPEEMQPKVIELIHNMDEQTIAELVQAPPDQQVAIIQQALGGM